MDFCASVAVDEGGMDFANICRACLYADQTLFSVFDPVVSEVDSGLGSVGITAAEMLKAFTTVVVSSTDDLPTKICTTCLDQIHRAYTFKLKCESSQTALRSLINELSSKASIQKLPKTHSQNEISQHLQEIYQADQTTNSDISDILNFSDTSLDDLNIPSVTSLINEDQNIPLEELSDKDVQMLNFNLNLDSLSDISHEMDTLDNIIIEYGDPLAEPKDTSDKWLESFYECPGCGKEFRKVGLLRNHIVDVHMEGKMCKICNEEYKTTIWKHISEHMPAKAFPCADCEKSFHSQFNLQMHRKMAHDDYLTCEYCAMRFRNMQKFRDHIFQHTGKHDFQCDICLKVLKRKSALVLHKQNHTGERPFKCDHCPKTFGYKGNLKFHIVAAHGGETLPYSCDICSKSFKNRPQLIKHQFEHTGNTELQCDVCSKVFETRYKLELHKKKHTGEKSFECQICGRGFRLKCNLKEHMGTHSDERPFQCQLCPCRYKRTYLLTLHVRNRHPEYSRKSKISTL